MDAALLAKAFREMNEAHAGPPTGEHCKHPSCLEVDQLFESPELLREVSQVVMVSANQAKYQGLLSCLAQVVRVTMNAFVHAQNIEAETAKLEALAAQGGESR